MLRSVSVAALLLASASPALAQRSNENIGKAADDGFPNSACSEDTENKTGNGVEALPMLPASASAKTRWRKRQTKRWRRWPKTLSPKMSATRGSDAQMITR